MEPSAAIAIIETDLRALVRIVYASSWTTKLAPEQLGELSSRLKEEERRRAPASVPQDLLAYTHFYELRKILASDWERVAPALGKRRDFDVWAEQVEDFRNAPAHSRELLWHERALLEGIAGMIRMRVTRYRSTQGPDSMYYPVIEHAEDSFGNAVDAPDPDGLNAAVATGLTLVPGDVVRFRVRATDAQGRELTWNLVAHELFPSAKAIGSEAELSWAVKDRHVSSHCYVEINMRSSSRYHRKSSYDQAILFDYRVNPPPEVK